MTEHVITACTNMFIVFHYGKFNIFVDIKNIETYEENKKKDSLATISTNLSFKNL